MRQPSTDACLPQGRHGTTHRRLVPVQHHAFGDLDLEERGRHSSALDLTQNRPPEIAVSELRAGAIDRHAAKGETLTKPARHIAEHGSPHHDAKVAHQIPIFEHGGENCGGEESAFGMYPARESFEAHEGAGRERHLRLVIGYDMSRPQSAAEVGQHRLARVEGFPHRGDEQRRSVPPSRF